MHTYIYIYMLPVTYYIPHITSYTHMNVYICIDNFISVHIRIQMLYHIHMNINLNASNMM